MFIRVDQEQPVIPAKVSNTVFDLFLDRFDNLWAALLVQKNGDKTVKDIDHILLSSAKSYTRDDDLTLLIVKRHC